MRVLEPVFEEHRVGILTKDEPHEFAEGCVRLLEDESLRGQMAENSRMLAEGDLSWDRIIDQLEAFYHSLIAAVR
jgi:glycosyltransferase involved in cell wall biosynthesis